jgi:ATP-dependent RNA helicase DeaD/ATP-dependent RNA helicase RhlE
MSFADLGVSRPVADALSKRGITAPFPVQRMVIGDVLAGHDVLVQSPTGSGKTLAFGVPIVERLQAGDRRPAALVLVPTRELALQIVDELRPLCDSRGLSIAPVYGGVGIEKQAKRAAKSQVIVATPGRLEDLLNRRAIELGHTQTLVLDEADRMLDMGFKPTVDRIVARTPRDRQTLFCSATLEAGAGKQARAYTRDARTHVHQPDAADVGEVRHRFVHLAHDAKVGALVAELRDAERGRTLVFVRTKRGADRLVRRLDKQRVQAVAMHGNKSQAQRQKALGRFAKGEVDTLVATDVAARGVDVEDITHVINFDAPGDREAYVHRVGRTARAGRDGTGISFILPEQAAEMRKVAADLGLSREFDHGRPTHVGGHQGSAGRRRPHRRQRHNRASGQRVAR